MVSSQSGNVPGVNSFLDRFVNNYTKNYEFDDNQKNCRVQMVSGKSAASVRKFVVDPWMLKMANVEKDLYHVEHWDNDTAVFRLALSKDVSKLLSCKFNNVRNCASLILSLTFIMLRSFSINERELRWQDHVLVVIFFQHTHEHNATQQAKYVP